MEIVLLGCGDAFSTKNRTQTSTLIIHKGKGVIIDCGPNTLQQLKKANFNPENIDCIFLTRLHGDRVLGLPLLLLSYYENKRIRPLIIAGPRKTKKVIEELFRIVYPLITEKPIPFEIKYYKLEPGREGILNWVRFDTIPAKHSLTTLSFKLMIEGKSIIISGDSRITNELIKFCNNADIALLECNMFSLKTNTRSVYEKDKDLFKKINAKRILLYHVGEEMERNLDKVNFEIATDLMRIKL